jgi:hypothetical protein
MRDGDDGGAGLRCNSGPLQFTFTTLRRIEMRFEDAIKAMRDGKACTRNGNGRAEYTIFCDTLHVEGAICTRLPLNAALSDDWHIVEPPLPLPRRFRAKYYGKPVVGSEFSNGSLYWHGASGSEYEATRAAFSQFGELKAIEYIDPPCTS